jgi:perosamine synthetase
MSDQKIDTSKVVDAVRSVLPAGKPAALHEPSFGGHEWQYVKECLDSGWVSYAGEYVNRFESMLQNITGVRHALAMSSGTVALHMALIVCDLKPGDEVLIPALTFVATANAVSHAGCIPHFVDSDFATLGMSPRRLDEYLEKIADFENGVCINKQTGRRIGAVIPMHTFGHPVDMHELLSVAGKYGIVVIEDAAESLGSLYENQDLGNFGRVAVLSFNGNKIVTTGGGGALLTNDPELARRAKHLSTTGKLPHKWEFRHDEVAYNYRMPSLNAALGCAQLEQLPRFLEKKRKLAELYKHSFAEVTGVDFFVEPPFARSNYWLNAIMVRPEFACDFSARDAILQALNDSGFMARPAWTLINRLPMYMNCPAMDLFVAEEIERRLINLPSSAGLVDVE